MNLSLVIVLIYVTTISLIETRIIISYDSDFESITHSGFESAVVSQSDMDIFFKKIDLYEAVKIYNGAEATHVFFKSPTPWGDLYKGYGWQEVEKITTVKSIKVTKLKKEPLVFTDDFENKSNKTIKVNTQISHAIENTLTTTWTKSQELGLSQELQYGTQFFSGKTGISFKSTWGKDEELSEKVTFGASTSVETELKPYQAVTSKLAVNYGRVELEVTYKTSLTGRLAVNYETRFQGSHFWGCRVAAVMESAGIVNEKTFVETVRMGIVLDGKSTVVDKEIPKPKLQVKLMPHIPTSLPTPTATSFKPTPSYVTDDGGNVKKTCIFVYVALPVIMLKPVWNL